MAKKKHKAIRKKCPILSLRPTQFSLGVSEINAKTKELKHLSKKEIRAKLNSDPLPVVISPDGHYYITDHHHLAYCCWQLGVRKIEVEIIGDLRKKKLSFSGFWRAMQKSEWFYPYDQFGDGPRPPLYLPQDVRGLADDPYRSLAWYVRESGGYKSVKVTFAEFAWADYFRKTKILHTVGRKGIEKCLKRALKLARSPRAKKLPGYAG